MDQLFALQTVTSPFVATSFIDILWSLVIKLLLVSFARCFRCSSKNEIEILIDSYFRTCLHQTCYQPQNPINSYVPLKNYQVTVGKQQVLVVCFYTISFVKACLYWTELQLT